MPHIQSEWDIVREESNWISYGKSNLLILITFLHQLLYYIDRTYPMLMAWSLRHFAKAIRDMVSK